MKIKATTETIHTPISSLESFPEKLKTYRLNLGLSKRNPVLNKIWIKKIYLRT
jgi:hypothetical protein